MATRALAHGASKVVLYGGQNEQTPLGDTWTWNGTDWQQSSEQGPPARSFGSMARDSDSTQILLFGGRDSSALLGDTWTRA